jgi:hypothetical protein
MLCYILPIDDSWSQDGAGWAEEEEELERSRRRRSVPGGHGHGGLLRGASPTQAFWSLVWQKHSNLVF